MLHQVEGRADDLSIVTERYRPGDRHPRPGQRAQDAVLPAHVMGGGQHMAERRTAEHEQAGLAGAGDRQAVRQVGAAAGDQLDIDQLRRLAADGVAEPAFEPDRAGNSRRTTANGLDLPNRSWDRTGNLNAVPMD